jgi:hypothetical protein
MATNNFKAFALDPNANVMSQADWEALPALLSGFTAGKASSAQVNKAIRQATFIASAVAQFVSDALTQDILDDGNSQAFVVKFKQAVVNGSVPAGIPMPWPTSTPPTGWLKCNGASFNTTTYPLLAKAYPSGVLPDLRGEFIRGWDDGRGVDTGRSLLSAQSDAIRNITGTVFGRCDRTSMKVFSNGSGAFVANKTGDVSGAVNSASVVSTDLTDRWTRLDLDVSKTVPVADDNRPRNISFNYIVRAA